MSESVFNEQQLAELIGNLAVFDLRPLLNEIGEILITSIDDNIREGGRFAAGDGAPGTVGAWTGGGLKFPPLAESTKAQKLRRNRDEKNILQDTGRMQAAFDKEVSTDTLKITNNTEYFPHVTLGSKDGTLPPRPVLVVQQEDLQEIEEAVEEFTKRIITSGSKG